MRKSTRSLVSAWALIMMIGAIFLTGKQELSSAQEEAPLSKQDAPFKTYLLGVYCAGPLFPTASFIYHVPEKAMGAKEICAGKCGGANVSLANALAGLPAGVSAALQTKVDAYQVNATAKNRLTCLGEGKKPAEKKCEPLTNVPQPPWLDSDVSCPGRSTGFLSSARAGSRRLTRISICGKTIEFTVPFSSGQNEKDPDLRTRTFEICCDSWLQAVKTRSPCDAYSDIDCDGQSNIADRFPEIPIDNRIYSDFFVPKGVIKPPTGPFDRPLWTKLSPPESRFECKNCKWELENYVYTCKNVPDYNLSINTGRDVFDARYHVRAFWKCPSTGQSKETEQTIVVPQVACPSKVPSRQPFGS